MKNKFIKVTLAIVLFASSIFTTAYADAGDPLTGTVNISGTLKFGEELTATYTLGNNTGILSYQWVRGAAEITSATSDKYTLVEADVGKLISVKVTSDAETGTIPSDSTTAIERADNPIVKGVTPVLDSKTDTSITVTSVVGYEYICVENNALISTGTWQDSNIFTSLTSSTSYDIYQRVKETATHLASGTSDKLDVDTKPAVLTGTVVISGTVAFDEDLTATYTPGNNTGTLSYQWVRGAAEIPSATSDKYTLVEADIGELILVKVTSSIETDDVTSAPTVAVEKANCAVAPILAPAVDSQSDTEVTLTAQSGYEYIMVADGADISTGTWQSSNVFSGLTANTAYDFYQRVAETSTHKASNESTKLDVNTAYESLTGSASISGTPTFGEELSAIYTPGNNTGTLAYQWMRDALDIATATSDKYTLTSDDIGTQISVKITSSHQTDPLTSNETAAVEKADNTVTPIVAPNLVSKTDAEIVLTDVAGYEYICVADGALISTGTWQDSNTFSGLSENTAYDIYQRVKETATHKASAESTKLDVTTNYSALATTAEITGTTVYGSTLNAVLTASNNTGTLSYQWRREGVDILTANSSSYTLVLEDIGKKISVKITSDAQTGTLKSEETSVIEKEDSITAKGITPVLSSKTSSTVTLTSVTEYEYIVVASGASTSAGTWQDSNVFTGLSGNTTYDFYQRLKETATQKPSADSDVLSVTTDTSTALTGTASISGTTVYGNTLTASLSSTNNTGTLQYQWVRGSTDIASATSSTYVLTASDVGQQIKVKISSTEETGVITSGATATVKKAASSPAKGTTPVLSSKTRHSVTLKYLSGYEYMVVRNGKSTSTGTWQSSSYFSGLSSGTSYDFYQRVKETSSNYASAISIKLDIKTYSSTTSATSTPKPTASPTPTVTLVPTFTPTATITPATTATVTPAPTVNVVVTPQAVKEDTKAGTIVVEIKTADLPLGTKSIKTSDNRIIEVNGNDSVFVTVAKQDVTEGTIELITLDEDGVALGSINMDVSEDNANQGSSGMPLWLKIVLGILIGAFVFTGVYVLIIRRRNYGY